MDQIDARILRALQRDSNRPVAELVETVIGANAVAGAGLDQHLVAVGGELEHALRGQADPVFVVFDFLRGANDHLCILRHDPMVLGRIIH